MDISQAYNSWAEQYDANINKTMDLEALANFTRINSTLEQKPGLKRRKE